MADANNKKQTFPVTAMQARRYIGGSVRVGSGGSWQADESLNQIATLLSQITFNQRALWRNIETMPQNIRNLSDDLVTAVSNQCAIDSKLKNWLPRIDKSLGTVIHNQFLFDQHVTAHFQEVNQNLQQLNQQMTALTGNLETLTQSVQTLADTVQTTQNRVEKNAEPAESESKTEEKT